VLFTVVPFRVLLSYVVDPQLRTRLRQVRSRGGVVSPLRYPRGDGGVRRRLVVQAITQNYRRKYARYYPQPAPE
jgi:D-aspartate ligase